MAWAFMSGKTESQGPPGQGAVSLRARAMRLLARREHSRAELRRKLEPKAAPGDDLEALLQDLAERGWLSDSRYAEHAIRARARRHGPLKLVHDLRAKGVSEEEIAAGFKAAGLDGASSIAAVWAVRFDSKPADDRELGRQVRFLQGRGFALDEVLKFLKRHTLP